MNTVLLEKPVEGKIVVSYDDKRLFVMDKIGERVCDATTDTVKTRLSEIEGLKIKRVIHAKKPSGSADLIMEFSVPDNLFEIVYQNIQDLKGEFFSINDVLVYKSRNTK
ncbi:hypothetical protein BD31_I1303 [Candidatus Nitrosopumilus salaria BD31]|uniref:Uncharacterized protein n=1 Tax=Candidatus Nitrosopumilus salarius BD31 TaxID=859350 RepID=I3D2V3_9ARCH|nr:hypothetical protein [Candidatus Nitrosopumilus salaria]EIJ66046.1 hypothetical protein BD31_I1303 [Candidatus Nitrosopumilus salaria BD31]